MEAYLAQVYDNRNFGKDGSIRVMLMQQSSSQGLGYLNEPLYMNFLSKVKVLMPSEFKEDALKSEDLIKDCLILGNCLGNGYNTGGVTIPQIGTIGLVIKINSIANEWGNVNFAWLGGIYGNKKYGFKVILPSDDTDDELGFEDKALITEEKSEEDSRDTISNSDYIKKGMYIVKTKTCNITNYKEAISNNLDLKNIPSDNTFVLKKDKLALKHNSYSVEEVDKETVDTKDENGKDLKEENKKTVKEKKYTQISANNLSFFDDSILLKREYKTPGFDEKKSKNEVKIEQKILFNNDEICITNKNDDGKDFNVINIKLENNGSLSIYSTGNINIKSEKDFNIESGKTLNIQSSEGIKINSVNDTVSISANNVNFAEMIKNIIEFLMRFTTIGNQATQNSSPKNIQEANEILKEMLKGFDTMNKDKTVTGDNPAKI